MISVAVIGTALVVLLSVISMMVMRHLDECQEERERQRRERKALYHPYVWGPDDVWEEL